MNEKMDKKTAEELQTIIDMIENKGIVDVDAQWDAYLNWCREQENSTHE